MKKRIVLISNIGTSIINFRKELIIDLVSAGHDVYCLAYGYTNIERAQIVSWGAIPQDHYLDLNGINPIKDLKGMFHLYKGIKKIAPDVVFNTFIKPVIFGTIVAKLARVPHIVGMLEGLGNAFTSYNDSSTLKTKIIKLIQVFLYKVSLPIVDQLIFLNPDDKVDLIDNFSIKVKKILVLGGIGVDLNKFSFSVPPKAGVSFIFIARLLQSKGIFEFLEAAKIIKKDYPDVQFLVLGASDKNNPFSVSDTILDDYINSQIIQYYGHIDNVAEVIAQSSIFVLPSYREGVPRSTQEAMAIGRAIITTDVPGCRETVEDGINGFLVPPYSVEKIVEKMIYFIENPSQINLMGLESRRIAEEKFDIKAVNRRLISIILDR